MADQRKACVIPRDAPALAEALLAAAGAAAAPHALAAFGTDWEALAAARPTLSDGAYAAELAATPLAAAAQRVFGPHQFILEPPFCAEAPADVAEALAHQPVV